MKKAFKIILIGVLIWIAGFAASLIVWPLHESQFMLFKSIMIVTGTIIGLIAIAYYFRRIDTAYIKEGAIAGFVWFAVNIVLDIIVLVGLFRMNLITYLISPGIGYLTMPVMSIGIGYILTRKK